jgi:hypothetical protein
MDEPEILFHGKRFRVERVVQARPDGTRFAKEIVRHPGAVTILPYRAVVLSHVRGRRAGGLRGGGAR